MTSYRILLSTRDHRSFEDTDTDIEARNAAHAVDLFCERNPDALNGEPRTIAAVPVRSWRVFAAATRTVTTTTVQPV